MAEKKYRKMGNIAQLYDENAEKFAGKSPQLLWWVALGIPAYNRHLGEFYGRKDLKIVDLGCASGRVEEFLTEKGIPSESFTGIEISPDQVELARKKFPKASFIVGDITTISLPQETYDLAISNMVLEFLDPKQLAQTFTNTFNWLKPDATFFFITTHPSKMQATSGLSEPGVFEVDFPWGGKGPNYYRTVDDFKQAILKAGFRIEQFEELNLPPEAKDIDPKEYERYMQYQNTRLVVKTIKPS